MAEEPRASALFVCLDSTNPYQSPSMLSVRDGSGGDSALDIPQSASWSISVQDVCKWEKATSPSDRTAVVSCRAFGWRGTTAWKGTWGVGLKERIDYYQPPPLPPVHFTESMKSCILSDIPVWEINSVPIVNSSLVPAWF